MIIKASASLRNDYTTISNMAKETKADYFRVSQENNVIQTWETFGWEVVTTQKCDYHGYDAVKITFSRDKDMKNYKELLRLDNEFHRDQDLIEDLKEEKEKMMKSIPEPPKFYFLTIFIFPLFLLHLFLYFGTKKEIEKKYQAAKIRSKEIDEQVSKLVDNCENCLKQAKALI